MYIYREIYGIFTHNICIYYISLEIWINPFHTQCFHLPCFCFFHQQTTHQKVATSGYLMFEVHRDLATTSWSNQSVYAVVSRLNYGGFECPWCIEFPICFFFKAKRGVQTYKIRTHNSIFNVFSCLYVGVFGFYVFLLVAKQFLVFIPIFCAGY